MKEKIDINNEIINTNKKEHYYNLVYGDNLENESEQDDIDNEADIEALNLYAYEVTDQIYYEIMKYIDEKSLFLCEHLTIKKLDGFLFTHF